jgi:hypothetical protein
MVHLLRKLLGYGFPDRSRAHETPGKFDMKKVKEDHSEKNPLTVLSEPIKPVEA